MELGGQLELLDSAVLVNDGVLVLGPPEGQELVVVVDAELGGIFPQVLHDLVERCLLRVRVGPLQVWVAVVRL